MRVASHPSACLGPALTPTVPRQSFSAALDEEDANAEFYVNRAAAYYKLGRHTGERQRTLSFGAPSRAG